MSKLISSTNEITVRVNTGANVGSRPRLNIINGAGISVTAVDDAGDNEIDITIPEAKK